MAPQLTHGLKDHRLNELPSAVIRLHGARGGNWIQDTRCLTNAAWGSTMAGTRQHIVPRFLL